MRKINFPPPVRCPARRNPEHWSEAERQDRTLNLVPIIPGVHGPHYLITSGHWLDLLTSKPENRLECFDPELNGQAILAHCTSHEAALAAFRLLNGAL